MSAAQPTFIRRNNHRRLTARSLFFPCHTQSHHLLVTLTLRPLMWPTLNPSLITRRRSSCPMSWETTCCLKMKCPTTLNTTLPTCLSRWTIIIHCRYWRRPQTYQYLQQRLTKLFTGQRDSSIVCGDCMVSVNFIIFRVTTRTHMTTLLQDSESSRWNLWCKSSMYGKSSRIRIAFRSVKFSPQKLSATTRSYLFTTFTLDLKRSSQNILLQSPTAMEIRVQRFQAMLVPSATKAHCNEQVSDDVV